MTKKQELKDQLLPNNYLPNLLNLVSSRGGNVARVLNRADLDTRHVEPLNATIRWAQFHDIIVAAREEINEPGLGLYLGSQLTITTHGLLGLAAMSSANLEETAEVASRYIATRTPLVALRLQKNSRYALLNIDELFALGDIRTTFLEVLAETLQAVIRFVSGNQCQLQEVRFAFQEPKYSSLYQAFFDCPVVFNAPANQLVLNITDLALPCILADSRAKQQAAHQCQLLLSEWQAKQNLSGQIRLILGRTKGRFPSYEQVADELAMAPRTLRRRLAEEETSYQQLVEIWRQDMAHQYLTTTGLGIQQIAYLLGYADPANFGRAFRKWHTGRSPSQYRQQHSAMN